VEQRLIDRVAIVTGAGGKRGIGRAIALGYGAAGATVVVAGGREADEVATEVDALGASSLALATDVSRSDSVQDMVSRTLDAFGRLDVLVNNAGIMLGGRLLDVRLEQWERSLAVNLTGVMLCGQAAARIMVQQGQGGRIVNISSLCPSHGCPSQIAYTATKGGVEALTLAMAEDLREYGITVNAIAPGNIYTRMSAREPPPELQPKRWDSSPLRSFGLPADLVGAAIFLASDEAAWITGTVLTVDGGRHLE